MSRNTSHRPTTTPRHPASDHWHFQHEDCTHREMAAHVKNAAEMVARNPGTAAVAGVVTVGAVALAAPLAIAAPVLAAVGFTAEGVAATSIAAGVQAGIGNVVGGSVFAICQSAAAGGAGAAAVATGTQVVGGVAAVGAALGKFLWGGGQEREEMPVGGYADCAEEDDVLRL
ncbi:hypothetical protein QC761_606745 [Podospora bellae-mahoneyi]|uniref:Uncharacterized protein n=1 Tax=Podospora bellae-mahoneyi TaxID=2093777 RepID=A0ABR0FDH3_9PEZI|nr:hypothetical protein QC761_606745 [Podospora bellae-mahoneyi]